MSSTQLSTNSNSMNFEYDGKIVVFNNSSQTIHISLYENVAFGDTK